jgi:glycine betaine/proline transport system permease protein
MMSLNAATDSLWQRLSDAFVVDLPIGEGFTVIVDYMTEHFDLLFVAIASAISFVAGNLTLFFNYLPPQLVFIVLAGLALWRVGWQFALFVLVGLYVVLGMNLWPESMDTLGLVIAATLAALGLGLPLGVLMAKNDMVASGVRPVLDFMQTLPAFVYLIPAVIFFGTGRVPGTIATVIFSMPPAVRLMNLGIRHVPTENVEAGRAFGCNSMQLLFKVQLPLALPSIMAGINQTIMLALSMVVIASMIGAGGLGDPVLAGIQQLRLGTGFEGGLGVVILAIILDRLTQSFAQPNRQREGLGTRLKQFFGRADKVRSS